MSDKGRRSTIVNNDAWIAMCISQLWKCSNHSLWIGQIEGNVDLGGSTFFVLDVSRCASDDVALYSKGLRYMMPNIGTEAEKKHDWRFWCHVWMKMLQVREGFGWDDFEIKWIRDEMMMVEKWVLCQRSYIQLLYPENKLQLCHYQRNNVPLDPSWPLQVSDLIIPHGAFGASDYLERGGHFIFPAKISIANMAQSCFRIYQSTENPTYWVEIDKIARQQPSYINKYKARSVRVSRRHRVDGPIRLVNASPKWSVLG
jgi:hypothetical protein